MQFNSYIYIFMFMPIFVLAYFFANRLNFLMGKILIIAASIIFYGYTRYEMLIFLGCSIVINYVASEVMIHEKNNKYSKITVIIPIAINIGLLLYFKYYNFALENFNLLCGRDYLAKDIILPLGISFYTFQQISYIVSLSKEELSSNSLLDYLCYILFFPKLVMGPLMEPTDFISQINDVARKHLNFSNIAVGVKLFSLGLIKKVLLADTFAKAVANIYADMAAATAMDCILLVLFYSFEIYFDFSGYSDMAIGIASMINIDLAINFNSPYKAISVRDFWKRWHISLTKFLTKYVYIPLGGSRKGKLFTYRNTIIVFFVSGFWHGANWTFILWGLLHGVFNCTDRLLENLQNKIPKIVRWSVTFTVVSFLWLLFSSSSVAEWISIIQRIVLLENLTISEGVLNSFLIPEAAFVLDILHLNDIAARINGFNMYIFIIVAFVICLIPDNNYSKKNNLTVGSCALSLLCFVWGVLCLGTESTFIYSGF